MNKKKKDNKYRWDARRIAIAAVAGGLALLMVLQVVLMAMV